MDDDNWRKLAQKPGDRHSHTPDRRRRKDPVLWIISVFGVVSWTLLVPSLLLIEKARPQLETFFDRVLELEVRASWDETAYLYAFFLMLLVLLVSGFGLILNVFFRNRRKTDSIRINLVLVFLISLLGVVMYVVRFMI